MRIARTFWLALFSLGFALSVPSGSAHAQFMHLVGARTIAIKSGESIDLGRVYWVSHCRSLLKELPTVEVIDGPQQISATIREEMVLPRIQDCPKKVKGGILVVSAKDIEDPSVARLTLRIHYKTRDGDRKLSEIFNLQLLP